MSRVLRVFVSSPGDVGEERVIAERVLSGLARQFVGQAGIEAVFWEHEPLLATSTFQTQIVLPSQTDIVVCVLWNRLGTRLPKDIQRPDGSTYASGTEFEFEDAVSAYRQHGTPDLLVYRKTARAMISLDDASDAKAQLAQKESLDSFVQNWFHGEDGTLVAAFHRFKDAASFEELLETHLRKLIEKHLDSQGITPAILWDAGSPFRGLEAFDREHAAIFFGRTQAISEVLTALRRQNAGGRPFLLLLGPSGSGKSSLARAGVLPMLTRPGVIEGVAWWRWATMRPGDSADGLMQALSAALLGPDALPELAQDGTDAAQLGKMLQERPEGAGMLVKGALSQVVAANRQAANPDRPAQARLVLLIDQLEEVFTSEQCSQPQRSDFFRAVGALVDSERVWVIATLRSDFYHRCEEIPELVRLKQGCEGQENAQYDVAPPAAAEIADIIRRPAAMAGLQFEVDEKTGARLDDVLRDDAVAEPGSLPLLEFTLDELYKQRDDKNRLTHQAYASLGGVAGALATRADEIVGGLSAEHRSVLRALFRLLVHVSSETERATRRIAPRAQLRSNPLMDTAAQALVDARLLVAEQDTVRIIHEKLLECWKKLRDWVSADRQLLLNRARVVSAAGRWSRAKEEDREDLLLAPGKPLQEALELLKEDAEIGLEPVERKFIEASKAKQLRRVRMRWGLGVAAAVLVVCTSLAVVQSYRSSAANQLAQVRTSLANLDLKDDGNRAILSEISTPQVQDVYQQASGSLRRRAALELIFRGQFDADQVADVFTQRDYFWDDRLDLANYQIALQAWQTNDKTFPIDRFAISVDPLPENPTAAYRRLTEQALFASVLISQGHFEPLVDVCRPSSDLEHATAPEFRVALERDLGGCLGDKDLFVEQFQNDMEPYVQAMVCRSLNFVEPELVFNESQRTAIALRLARLCDSPHASVLASAAAALTTWQLLPPPQPAKTRGDNWYELSIGQDVRLRMVAIPQGTLVRFDKPANGSTRNSIPVTREFWLASTETTSAAYRLFLRENPAFNPTQASPDDLLGDMLGGGFGDELGGGFGGDPSDSGDPPVAEVESTAAESEGATLPAREVSWLDAVAFCNWLSQRSAKPLCYFKIIDGEKHNSPPEDSTTAWEAASWECDFTLDGFRLPTEVEWEYACRAGSSRLFSFGDSEQLADDYAWTIRNSPEHPQAVAALLPNAWGLFDMHGNVREWCWDPYTSYPEPQQTTDNYIAARGASAGVKTAGVVVRGGAYRYPAAEASCGDRMPYAIDVRDKDLGFRIAQTR